MPWRPFHFQRYNIPNTDENVMPWTLLLLGYIFVTNKTKVDQSGQFIVHYINKQVFLPGTWWRHQMETFSALLAICAGNSPVPGEFPSQRPVTRSFDVFFDLHLNKRLSKQSWGWWFETLWCPLWRHRNAFWYSSVNHTKVLHKSQTAPVPSHIAVL